MAEGKNEKYKIRKLINERKTALGIEEKVSSAQRIFEQLEARPEFINATHILIYHSLPDEVETREFITRWQNDKELFLPVVKGEQLVIKRYCKDNLTAGMYGIMEPSGNEYPPELIDLVIVPGIAFDRKRNRLGRGKGYYDRLLNGHKCLKAGIAYSCQIIPELPAEPHDIKMDIIITPDEIINE